MSDWKKDYNTSFEKDKTDIEEFKGNKKLITKAASLIDSEWLHHESTMSAVEPSSGLVAVPRSSPILNQLNFTTILKRFTRAYEVRITTEYIIK